MRIFSKKEMGGFDVKDLKWARLPQKFIRKHLPLHIIHWESLPYETDIQCPFCNKGVIVLRKREREICEVHLCHTGDSYEFWCSNRSECVALFTYTNTWLYC